MHLLPGTAAGVSQGVRDAQTGYDAVCPNGPCDGDQAADQDRGNPGTLQFLHHRCTATRAGPSRGGEDHPHLILKGLPYILGDLLSEPCGIVDGSGVPGGSVKMLPYRPRQRPVLTK